VDPLLAAVDILTPRPAADPAPRLHINEPQLLEALEAHCTAQVLFNSQLPEAVRRLSPDLCRSQFQQVHNQPYAGGDSGGQPLPGHSGDRSGRRQGGFGREHLGASRPRGQQSRGRRGHVTRDNARRQAGRSGCAAARAGSGGLLHANRDAEDVLSSAGRRYESRLATDADGPLKCRLVQ
jgi:hypothetical protein